MTETRLTTTRGGIRVITEPLPGTRSVALGIWVGVGSRYETESEAGIAHFIEHLVFKGTPSHTAREIAELFDGLGGEVNAATGRDYTVFYTRVLDDHVERAFPVLADMLQHPGFYELDQEREVVLEEIAMYEDDPQDKVHDMLGAAVFPDQPLGRPVIGTAEVISTVSHANLGAYFTSHYTAPNMVVAASGNIDHDALCELCERVLADVPSGNGPLTFVPAAAGPALLSVHEKATEQYHLAFGAPGITRDDPRRHAQAVLDTVLGGSMSSRLFQEIREKRGLAYSVGSYTVGYSDSGQAGLFLGTRRENLRLACEVIRTELDRLAGEPLGDTELQRTKDHLKGRLVLSLESASTRMNRIGRACVTGTELLTIDELVAAIDAVTPDDVQSMAQEIWRPERFSLAAIGSDTEAIREAAEAFSANLAA